MRAPIEFGSFSYVALTDVWQHEALEFTPWLSANLDRLSEPLGIELELIGTEVDVGGYSADILARDVQDGRNVLIENQLSPSDHTHLGQILTYLAGLNAKLVVWIAPSFRDPHLSAIRWLNEHTEESIAFFAVQVRLVRIAGCSPIVPSLEVVEGPNEWDRRIQVRARELGARTDIGAFRQAFWKHYFGRFPSEGDSATPYAAQARWRRIPEHQLILTQFIGYQSVGVFVRAARNGDQTTAFDRLARHSGELAERLESSLENGASRHFFAKELKLDMREQSNWDRASDWLKSEADQYETVLREVLGGTA